MRMCTTARTAPDKMPDSAAELHKMKGAESRMPGVAKRDKVRGSCVASIEVDSNGALPWQEIANRLEKAGGASLECGEVAEPG